MIIIVIISIINSITIISIISITSRIISMIMSSIINIIISMVISSIISMIISIISIISIMSIIFMWRWYSMMIYRSGSILVYGEMMKIVWSRVYRTLSENPQPYIYMLCLCIYALDGMTENGFM